MPDDLTGDERTMAELRRSEKDAISHRGRAARAPRVAAREACDRRAGAARRDGHRRGACSRPLIAPDAVEGSTKFGAARLSIVSNSVLIVLKVVAGAVTGSIAIITEAVHSSIDLLASIVAYLSLRKADEPADADHMYGHAKVENLAAAIEGMLILVGAGVIVFEAVAAAGGRRRRSTHIGFGIAVIAISAVVNLVVSTYLYRQARAHDSPALEGDAAHLRADAATSLAVLVGLVLIEVTGVQELDAIVALMVAVGDRLRGRADPDAARRACWWTRRCRRRSSTWSGRLIADYPGRSWSASTSCAAAARAARATSTCTCSSRRARRWSARTRSRTSCRTSVRDADPGADVLVHIEPSTAARRGGDGAGEPADDRRLGKQVDRRRQADEQRAPRCSRRSR